MWDVEVVTPSGRVLIGHIQKPELDESDLLTGTLVIGSLEQRIPIMFKDRGNLASRAKRSKLSELERATLNKIRKVGVLLTTKKRGFGKEYCWADSGKLIADRSVLETFHKLRLKNMLVEGDTLIQGEIHHGLRLTGRGLLKLGEV